MDISYLMWIVLFISILLLYIAMISKGTGTDHKNESEITSRKPSAIVPDVSYTFMPSGRPVDPDSPWGRLRTRVMERDGFRCVTCGSSVDPTVDHIKELSLGGTNDILNLRTLCKDCHEDRHLRRFLDRGFDASDNYGNDYKLGCKIAAVDKALNNKTTICIRYKDRFGVRSIRVIHPMEVWRRKKSGKVYITAYDELDKGERIFRLSRLELSNNKTSRYLDRPKVIEDSIEWRGFRDS